MVDAFSERLRALLSDLMLVPGLSGYEGRVRRATIGELGALGLAPRSDHVGNLIATIEGDAGATRVMLVSCRCRTAPIARAAPSRARRRGARHVRGRSPRSCGRRGRAGPYGRRAGRQRISCVQLVNAGVAAIDLGFPTRYTHSSLEACDLSDLVGLTRLLVKGIERIDRTFSLDRDNDVE